MQYLIGVLLLLGYIAIVIVVNRTRTVRAETARLDRPGNRLNAAGSEISVSTWNLGYAGLGRLSDFVADGGTRIFPPSRSAVRENLAGIIKTASGLDVDVALYQEVARAGPLNLWVSLDAALADLMANREYWFHPDVSTWGLPFPMRLMHGLAIASKLGTRSAEVVPLPKDSKPMLGLLARLHAMQVVAIADSDGEADWIVVNLHLPAFDDGGNLRRDQLKAVFEFAETKYREGNRVILGGDWNMALAPTEFPSDTPKELLFWIHDLPVNAVPDGWAIAADTEHPTVRTLYQPYIEGENHAMVVDGFIVSPNVRIVEAATRDAGFAHSDHNPVVARFRARNSGGPV